MAFPKITFSIPVINFIILLVGVVLPLLYSFTDPSFRDLIVFLTTCLGAAGAIIGAVYVGWGLEQGRKDEREREEQRREDERKLRSYRFLERFNDPSFFQLKKDFGQLMGQIKAEKIKDKTATNQVVVMKVIGGYSDNHATIIEMLNFFEEIAIALEKEAADEEILMDAFKTWLDRTYHLLEDWIKDNRGSKHRVFKSLEALHNKWKKN